MPPVGPCTVPTPHRSKHPCHVCTTPPMYPPALPPTTGSTPAPQQASSACFYRVPLAQLALGRCRRPPPRCGKRAPNSHIHGICTPPHRTRAKDPRPGHPAKHPPLGSHPYAPSPRAPPSSRQATQQLPPHRLHVQCILSPKARTHFFGESTKCIGVARRGLPRS